MLLKIIKNKYFAFSLIELMITLITISCIIAAFTPVISKRLKSSNVTIKGNNVSDITTNCSDKFSNSCKLCTKSYCIQCDLSNCTTGTYAESKSCTCKDCSTLYSNCIECDSTKCTKCKDNNYYINNGKCEICPSNKICDGINAHDETYCTNPPAGYFCEGNTIKKCIDKYNMYCATCNSSQCLSCNSTYYLSNGSCLPCSSGCVQCINANYCTKCGNWVVLNTTTHKCEKNCNAYLSNCVDCTSATNCTRCYGGYYLNSGKCLSCTNIANCINCSSGSVCVACKTGYYVNSSNTCSKCTVSNCARCNTDGTCESCNSGYYLSDDKKSCIANDNKFNCSDSNFMRIGNLCVTRKNMGDSSTLKIPSTVTTVEANGDYCYSQSDKCCWKGTTSTGCNSSNGSYSGCNRTVCNYSAAQEICAKFNYAGKTWRLATGTEAQYWAQNIYGIGNNGLMFCNHGLDSLINNSVTACNASALCLGSYANFCHAFATWFGGSTSSLYAYIVRMDTGNFTLSSQTVLYGSSVRCVTEME